MVVAHSKSKRLFQPITVLSVDLLQHKSSCHSSTSSSNRCPLSATSKACQLSLLKRQVLDFIHQLLCRVEFLRFLILERPNLMPVDQCLWLLADTYLYPPLPKEVRLITEPSKTGSTPPFGKERLLQQRPKISILTLAVVISYIINKVQLPQRPTIRTITVS
jgi:hypothetical protein